ncbi:DoxX family protein [Streptomyces reniochalinae]|uniref:DoxX family protein n=1 Tax=Streptomyces reniochalinae TaxID=2250578 RepID=A0A367EPY2_9ACTN|nr:DoxX family protein [Streptomyces reniochalinae]RCG19260.1 DoxX family protein [Streptomyces reniochalinae]
MSVTGPGGGGTDEGAKTVHAFPGPVAGAPVGVRGLAARYALLPLRLFLGITFLYAGIHKLTDGGFLTGSGPGSFAGTLRAAHETAAAPWLVDLAQQSPQGFATALSVAEIAVGCGTLCGLWARVAAAGGALLSLCLWLTVSWSSEPYYYGNDLPYLMAWLPLLLAGAPLVSLDALLAVRRRRKGQQIFG